MVPFVHPRSKNHPLAPIHLFTKQIVPSMYQESLSWSGLISITRMSFPHAPYKHAYSLFFLGFATHCSVPYTYFSHTHMGCPYAYGPFFLVATHTHTGCPYRYGHPLVHTYAYECLYAYAYLPNSFHFQLASYSCSYYRWSCAWVSIKESSISM